MSDAVESAPQSRSSGKKSPGAFRTISEVADALNVPQHVLRFWESKFSQVKPMKRGGGRRYYRPEDVHLLRGIRNLLYHEGYTIRGVQKVLKDAGTKVVVDTGRESGGEDNGDQAEAEQTHGADPIAHAATSGESTSLEAGAGGLGSAQRQKLEAIVARLNGLSATLKETD